MLHSALWRDVVFALCPKRPHHFFSYACPYDQHTVPGTEMNSLCPTPIIPRHNNGILTSRTGTAEFLCCSSSSRCNSSPRHNNKYNDSSSSAITLKSSLLPVHSDRTIKDHHQLPTMAVATEKPFKMAPESPSVVCRKRRIHQPHVGEKDLLGQSCRRRKLNRAHEQRKVQFNLTNTQYIESSPPTTAASASSPACTWLPNEVYRTYHETSYKIAERIQQQANTFEPKYLSYESCIQRVLHTCLECSPELHPTDKVILWNWATIGDVRRGLEKLSVPHVASELKRRKVGLISDILKLQNATVTSPCGNPVTGQEKAALFQRISQQYSKPSCLFAKALGKADEIAAKKEYKNGIQIQLPSPPPSSSS